MQGLWKKALRIGPCLNVFGCYFLKWRSVHMHHFHSFKPRWRRSPQQAKMTADECSLVFCVEFISPMSSHTMPGQHSQPHSHFVGSSIRCMSAAISCHLHFWWNDWGLLHATAVTQGWNRYRNQNLNRKLTLEKKFSLHSYQGSNPLSSSHESAAQPLS